MKNHIKVSAFLLMLCCVFACKKSQIETPAPAPSEPDFYTVQFGWNGDILEVIEEPLKSGSQNDVYGIQVYSTPNKEGSTASWTPYAYGLFDYGDNISINLMKGYKYKFVASMIVDAKTKLGTSTQNGAIAFLSPFSASGWTPITNKFDYQSGISISGLGSGSSYMEQTYAVPNTERFYGEYLDYIPGLKNNEKVMIHMKRTSFGAKFIAKGKLAKSGQLEVQITGAPKIMIELSNSEKSHSEMYTFKNVKNAYENNTYTETHDVTINWHKEDGTIFPLGTHKITYKRNKMTTVNVAIETEHSDSGLGVDIDDTDMTEDDVQTTIKDGEIVETEIDTNA